MLAGSIAFLILLVYEVRIYWLNSQRVSCEAAMSEPKQGIRLFEHRWSWGEERFKYREILLNTPQCHRLLTGEHSTGVVEYDSNLRKLVCVRTIGAAPDEDLPSNSKPKSDL